MKRSPLGILSALVVATVYAGIFATRKQAEARRTETARVAALSKTAPLSRNALAAKFRAARDLARAGQPALALRELIWCLDEGLNQSDSSVRVSLQGEALSGF